MGEGVTIIMLFRIVLAFSQLFFFRCLGEAALLEYGHISSQDWDDIYCFESKLMEFY